MHMVHDNVNRVSQRNYTHACHRLGRRSAPHWVEDTEKVL
jgi:hypothetical protein